jgi:hypothetical protein
VRPSRTGPWAPAAAGAALWAMVVPLVGRAAGLTVDVPASVELVDHALPGVVVLAAAAFAATGAHPLRPGDVRWSLLAGAAFLAGFWSVATHVLLVPEAIDGVTPWGAALLHLSAGVPVLAVGVAMLVLPLLGGVRR